MPALLHRHPLAAAAPLRALRRVLYRALTRAALARSRRHLLELDDHLLRDIGLTRDLADAEAQARGPVWDAPLHWRQR